MAGATDSPAVATYGRRNIFYLRVSPTLVLPCILYLDPRHVLWLNTHPSILHSALHFLKPRILTKLEREAKVIRIPAGDDRSKNTNAAPGSSSRRPYFEKRKWGEISGKEVVDVARQPEFHLAYFFRKQTDRHAVLIKDKDLIFPKGSGSGDHAGAGEYTHTDPLSGLAQQDGEADASASSPSGAAADIQVKRDPEEEEENLLRSLHADNDDGDGRGTRADSPPDEKPKFKLRVRYRGFKIFTKSLILVLEPSPAARARSPDLFVTQQPQTKRQLSATPTAAGNVPPGMVDPRPANNRDARTASTAPRGSTATPAPSAPPLFFRDASMTPSDEGTPGPSSSSSSSRRIRPPTAMMPRRNPADGDEDDDDDYDVDIGQQPDATADDWAERMRAQSVFNARTLADHDASFNSVGESRSDEYAQMMSDAMGGQDEGD